jgi:hypothetical protein
VSKLSFEDSAKFDGKGYIPENKSEKVSKKMHGKGE